MRGVSLSVALVAAALFAGALSAHVRLINSGNGRPLYWSNPANIGITISSQGSDNLPDQSDLWAMRGSIASWNRATGTSAQLVEDTAAASQARTDWAADDLHLMMFDETNSSGYLPPGSGIVAVTPVWFVSGGRIIDADVLFNGRTFSFTTSGQSGSFDVEDVATHELGHLLGLDHSGCVGASLYPYVSPGMTLHRSISSDDEHGLRDAYPSGSRASISGTVRRASGNSPLAGAYVVVRSSAGRTVASALTASTGTFQINGLASDTYVLYATPLDFPVSSANLTAGRTVQVDFQSTVHGAVAVLQGQQVAVGDVVVDADTSFSLGRNFDPLPLQAVIDRTRVLSLHGVDLWPGSTLEAGDPAVQVGVLSWQGNQVLFDVSVPSGAAAGHVDLIATSPFGERSILCGALELVPVAPSITAVTPAEANIGGGELLTITGRHFSPGLRLVLGDRVYTDGVVGGCSVIDSNTVQLTCAPTAGGTYDVVAIDVTGVEGRLASGFQFVAQPSIQSLFPPAGAAAGGTLVTIVGNGFVSGSSVSIDGISQSDATVVDTSRLHFTTEPGVLGGPFLVEILNPGGAIATAAFSYVAQADPNLTAVDPAESGTQGAVPVTLHGSGFNPTSVVTFGADPNDGTGGSICSSVNFIDAQTLEVIVPAHASGVVSILVSDPSSGQATVLPAAFTYRSSGGGGGCAAVRGIEPPRARTLLEGTWWMLAALVGAHVLTRSRVQPRIATQK